MSNFKKRVKSIPFIGKVITTLSLWVQRKPFRSSTAFWEERYAEGGTSGSGSYNRLAEFKADVINTFVHDNNIEHIIELGCGDGNQLRLMRYPHYVGTDVSKSAIDRCKKQFEGDQTKSFLWVDASKPISDQIDNKFDLSLSLDVIYHLVEQDIFERHLRDLFALSNKYVVVYSSNEDSRHMYHEKHRKFTDWIDAHIQGWQLESSIKNKFPYDPESPENTSKANFFIYRKD